MREVVVRNRSDAERYRGAAPYAVVSIAAPGESEPHLSADEHRIARLTLYFADTPNEGDRQAMQQWQAECIAAFVSAVAPHIRSLVVHCGAGRSRSPAVAACVAQAWGLPFEFLRNPPYNMNTHVRRLMMERWGLK